jgi:NAD(P)-dependent dehydrogenase (short-subunit alcohol dehydrogenase family)
MPTATTTSGGDAALAGRVAVVTGASRGIGRAIAASFVAAGARVAGCGRNDVFADVAEGRDAGAFWQRFDRAGNSAGAFFGTCDVRDRAHVDRFAALVLERLGVPDILVNNAGIVVRGAFATLPFAAWQDVIDSNVHGTFHVTQAFLPAMLARGAGGRIINLSSIAGRQGTALLSAYNTAKHAVVGLTRSLAEELRDSGICVNAICPGSVDTDMLKIGMPGGAPKMAPSDVATTARFLAAEAPMALTGACIDVFG